VIAMSDFPDKKNLMLFSRSNRLQYTFLSPSPKQTAALPSEAMQLLLLNMMFMALNERLHATLKVL